MSANLKAKMNGGCSGGHISPGGTETFGPRGLAMVRRTLGGDVPVYPVGPFVRDEGDGDGEHDAAVLGWQRRLPLSALNGR